MVDGFPKSKFSVATGTTMELFQDLPEQVGSVSSSFLLYTLCTPPLLLGVHIIELIMNFLNHSLFQTRSQESFASRESELPGGKNGSESTLILKESFESYEHTQL